MPEEIPVTRRDSEADARIFIDDLLRAAHWDPGDKSQVGTEVPASAAGYGPRFAARSEARPFETHAPVYDLIAAAGSFGPDQLVGTDGEMVDWMAVPGHQRLTRDHFVARVGGRSMEPTVPDGAHCLFRVDPGGSRDGRLVLVWHRGCTDPASGTAGFLIDAVDHILARYREEPRSWWASFDAVDGSDFNLAASRDKPRVAEEVPAEDPAELIREVLAIEKEIIGGLVKLLREIEA